MQLLPEKMLIQHPLSALPIPRKCLPAVPTQTHKAGKLDLNSQLQPGSDPRFSLWKSQKSHDLLNTLHLEPLAIPAGFWRENLGPGQLTSAMTCLVAGVSGVYRIFPTSRGLRAFHMMRESGLDSKLFITSLQ